MEPNTTRVTPAPAPPEHDHARRHRGPRAARRAMRIVAIGGGTGLPAVLAGLARAGERGFPALDVTAIVAMSDDGGSSGRLHREQGILPPGDVRNCLVALADERHRSLARLFQYRFGRGRGLKGHAMGNLVLSALTSLEGDFLAAVHRAGRMLRCRGRVLPCTLDPVRLRAQLTDGSALDGERNLGRAGARIERLALSPSGPRPAPGVLEAIVTADVVVLGPGSLFSSVIAPLLVPGITRALRACTGLRIFVQNLMSQPGETDGLDAAGHLRALLSHAGDVVDVLLADPLLVLPSSVARRYAERGQRPVKLDARAITALGVLPVEADLAAAGRRLRHDPDKSAAALLGLALDAAEA